MQMKVKNLNLSVGKIEVDGISQSSILLVGDAEVIASSSIFDTPSHSVIYNPQAPLKPVNSKTVFVEEEEEKTEVDNKQEQNQEERGQ